MMIFQALQDTKRVSRATEEALKKAWERKKLGTANDTPQKEEPARARRGTGGKYIIQDTDEQKRLQEEFDRLKKRNEIARAKRRK